MIRTMMAQTPGGKMSPVKAIGALKKMPKGGKGGGRFPRFPFNR